MDYNYNVGWAGSKSVLFFFFFFFFSVWIDPRGWNRAIVGEIGFGELFTKGCCILSEGSIIYFLFFFRTRSIISNLVDDYVSTRTLAFKCRRFLFSLYVIFFFSN